MKTSTKLRLTVLVSVVVLPLLALILFPGVFMPARALLAAHLAVTADGSRVLVAETLAGSSLQSGQALRFDFFDPKSGERVHRARPTRSFCDSSARLLGAGVRQWWGYRERVLLLDPSTGSIIAEDGDLLAANPVLRGELHAAHGKGTFAVDESGALLVEGGSGVTYAIDAQTLVATPRSGPVRAVAPARAERIAREIEGVEPPSTTPPSSDARVELTLLCRTITAGPCGLRGRIAGRRAWELSASALGGRSALGVAERDDHTAYVYVADDSLFGSLTGGTWLYAVELESGKVAWTAKL